MNKAQQNQSTLFSLLVSAVFIFAVFYPQESPGGEGLRIPYNNWVWIFAILGICAAIFQIILKKLIVLPHYWLGIAALPLGLMISGFIIDSSKPTLWLFKIAYVVGGYCFFISLFQFNFTRREIENILYTLCCAAMAHSAIGATQIMGWHFSSFIPRTTFDVPISFFQQVNVHGSFLISAFLIACYLATTPSIKHRPLGYKLIILLTIAATTTTLLAVGSRTTLVAFMVCAPLIVAGRLQKFKQHRQLAKALCLAFVVGLSAGGGLSDGLAKYETKLDAQKTSARIYIYDLSWQIFKQKPLLGHGLGSFERVFQEAKIGYQHSAKMGSQRYGHPHNEMLLWMIESGITAIVGILIAALVTLKALFNLGWRRAATYTALIFPISFHTQTELPFYLSSALWFLWLSLLYIIHCHRAYKYPVTLSIAAQTLISTVSIVLSCLFIGFLIHTLVALSGIVKYVREKDTDFSKLAPAHANIYHQDLAQHIQLTTLLYIDIATGGEKYADLYIQWAKSYLINNPVTNVINDLTLAYYYLGERDKALNIIEKGSRMYPSTAAISDRLADIKGKKPIEQFKQKIKTDARQSRDPATELNMKK